MHHKIALFLLVFLFGVSLMAAGCATSRRGPQGTASPAQPPELPQAWLELGPSGARIARVITTDKQCPTLDVDGAGLATLARAEPTSDFPALVCEAFLPETARAARLGSLELPVPAARGVGRVVVIGDTGCRVKKTPQGQKTQDCDSPEAWPFARVAEAAAQLKPDLVVHVGDYLYREVQVGSWPAGDRLGTWLADFFTPAQRLLRAAPWVFVRGNHENCARGGEGWRRFLDPRPYAAGCNDFSDPYWIRLGRFSLAVFDTAGSDDAQADPSRVSRYERALERLEKFPVRHAFLATHKPLWNPAALTGDLAQAMKGRKLKRYSALLAGHAHLYGELTFTDGAPLELISGNSGTMLLDKPTEKFEGVKVSGRTIRSAELESAFGFGLLEARGSHWTFREVDAEGKQGPRLAIP